LFLTVLAVDTYPFIFLQQKKKTKEVKMTNNKEQDTSTKKETSFISFSGEDSRHEDSNTSKKVMFVFSLLQASC